MLVRSKASSFGDGRSFLAAYIQGTNQMIDEKVAALGNRYHGAWMPSTPLFTVVEQNIDG